MAVLRKIKSKIKTMMKEGKRAPSSTRKTSPKKTKATAERMLARIPRAGTKRVVSRKTREEILGAQETVIEKAKFSHSEAAKYSRSLPHDVPYAYGKDKLVLQVRDPWWLYSYWEVTVATIEKLKQRLKDAFYSAKRVLRVYDVSQIDFNGHNAHRYFDIEVRHESNAWYIDTGGPGRSWCVDFGLKLPNGEFITILRSNVVQTPLDGPSWMTDEEWMVPEEIFGRLYGLGFGFGQSSPVGKAWQERVKRALFSGVLASPGMASMASPVKKAPGKQRKFWMIVDCELIVYGATEPDATVFVQDKQIKLRPDGTFTLRYALPDGKQVIPVRGVSNDKEEERVITPIVTRETR